MLSGLFPLLQFGGITYLLLLHVEHNHG
jgi:hypothetical protein